jgi:hypothetical protein
LHQGARATEYRSTRDLGRSKRIARPVAKLTTSFTCHAQQSDSRGYTELTRADDGVAVSQPFDCSAKMVV